VWRRGGVGGGAALAWTEHPRLRRWRRLLPPLALMAGRGLHRLLDSEPAVRWRRLLLVAGTLLVIGLVFTGWQAARWRIDLGRDHYPLDRSGEIVTLARYLNAKPLGAIIYDHWLGWEMGYYLGAWTDKRRVYYPEPSVLARDARLNPDPAPRYLIAPAGVELDSWLRALAQARFDLRLDYRLPSFVVIRVIPPWSRLTTSNPDQVLQGCNQVVGQIRLGQVAICPGIETSANLLWIGQRRQDNDRQIIIRRFGPHLPQELQTVHIGQHHVEDDNIR